LIHLKTAVEAFQPPFFLLTAAYSQQKNNSFTRLPRRDFVTFF
jgi:hypothetical protein